MELEVDTVLVRGRKKKVVKVDIVRVLGPGPSRAPLCIHDLRQCHTVASQHPDSTEQEVN